MELFNSAAESLTIFGRQLNIYCAREKEKEDGAFCHDHSTHTLDAGFTAQPFFMWKQDAFLQYCVTHQAHKKDES